MDFQNGCMPFPSLPNRHSAEKSEERISLSGNAERAWGTYLILKEFGGRPIPFGVIALLEHKDGIEALGEGKSL